MASAPGQADGEALSTERKHAVNDTPKNTDDAKGSVKEAAGDLTGDDELKREGKVDQATGTVKDKVDDVKDKVEDAIDGVRDRVGNRD